MTARIDGPADGGPAHPWTERNSDGTHHQSHEGMSLRDYFAAQALTGWLASFGPDTRHPATRHPANYDEDNPTANSAKLLAKRSYALADAMLAARKAP